MIKERARELVAALRSGEYQQTHSTLHHDNAYCCLGVACEISGLGHWRGGRIFVDKGNNKSSSVLTKLVQIHFGFADPLGGWDNDRLNVVIDDEEHSTLTSLNDYGWTFAQIADFIEKHWEVL